MRSCLANVSPGLEVLTENAPLSVTDVFLLSGGKRKRDGVRDGVRDRLERLPSVCA